MPGLTIQSSSTIRVLEHYSAEAFLAVSYPTLRKHERSSNIIVAHALKKVTAEAALTGCQFVTQSEVTLHAPSSDELGDSLWLTVWSTSPQGILELELVLACHRVGQHELPVFLWATQHKMLSSPQWLAPRVSALADRLASCVPPTRVFSVFGMTALVKAFSRCWTSLTGFEVEPDPFYLAYFTCCTKETLTESKADLPFGHVIRRGVISDVEDIARLGKGFADDSIHFPLTIELARDEARELVSKGQIWLYEVSGAVAAICAVTRSSMNVSAITKVYTCPKWRRLGFAEHLVRDVTRRLLDSGKESVVLYVGHENSARRVYHRVGFVGLSGKPDERAEGVEDALELGFIGTNRGHW
ncbi:hypothetical protein JVT61DRAFT_5341 [Boletus reticuloceps]|uniref:N-acetyltransferase domain-containing protein n=1 Tax=Boletus reticuloceps TaxID=495285 RepID=A0A8I3AD44_9AGAM|nr:hypothetical protein JVT61DRAFT_5341 [Boletus reticuloceps]